MTMEAFNDRFAEGVATPGPFLVEVVLGTTNICGALPHVASWQAVFVAFSL
jgi:hypothetical protein